MSCVCVCVCVCVCPALALLTRDWSEIDAGIRIGRGVSAKPEVVKLLHGSVTTATVPVDAPPAHAWGELTTGLANNEMITYLQHA